jgi:hypothetical protein
LGDVLQPAPTFLPQRNLGYNALTPSTSVPFTMILQNCDDLASFTSASVVLADQFSLEIQIVYILSFDPLSCLHTITCSLASSGLSLLSCKICFDKFNVSRAPRGPAIIYNGRADCGVF